MVWLNVVATIFGREISLSHLHGVTNTYDDGLCGQFGCTVASISQNAPANLEVVLSLVSQKEEIVWRGTGPRSETLCLSDPNAGPPPSLSPARLGGEDPVSRGDLPRTP